MVARQTKSEIKIPNFIDGEFRKSKVLIPVSGCENNIHYSFHLASYWDIEAALETVSRKQTDLAKISVEDIFLLLRKAMEFFLGSSEELSFISKVTGSPPEFTISSLKTVKTWACKLQEIPFISSAVFSQEKKYLPTAPIVAFLPSNSEHEVLYIVAQVLLSKNALLLRPSSKGACSFVVYKLILALERAISELGMPHLKTVLESITVVHTSSLASFPEQLSISGWNYIFFGSDQTLATIQNSLNSFCTPRAIVPYGSGFSSSVVLSKADLALTCDMIYTSVTVNKGNECDSTDVVYIHEAIAEAFLVLMKEKITEKNEHWIIYKENFDFISQELGKFRQISPLNYFFKNGNYFVTPSLIQLHEFERCIEFPGPVFSVRIFKDIEELKRLFFADLSFNKKKRNLVTSLYSKSEKEVSDIISFLPSYTIKVNKPTHEKDFSVPHQSFSLIEIFSDSQYIIK